MKKILANKVYSDATLKSWTKADLIEQIRILEHNWSCAEERFNNSVKNSEKIFYEQKAEIERLTEVKEEVKQLKEYTAVLKEESEKLKQSCADAVNSFIRMETLYKIKCNELKIANKKLEELKGGKVD